MSSLQGGRNNERKLNQQQLSYTTIIECGRGWVKGCKNHRSNNNVVERGMMFGIIIVFSRGGKPNRVKVFYDYRVFIFNQTTTTHYLPDCTAAAVLLQFLLPLSMPRGYAVDGQKQCCTRLPMTCFCLALSKCTQIRPQTKCKYFKFISFSSRRGPTFWSHSTVLAPFSLTPPSKTNGSTGTGWETGSGLFAPTTKRRCFCSLTCTVCCAATNERQIKIHSWKLDDDNLATGRRWWNSILTSSSLSWWLDQPP